MRRRFKLFMWRYRYVIAAGLLGIAVLGLVREMRPPPPGVLVTVAAVDLPPGVPITAADLTTAHSSVAPRGLAADPVGLSPVVAIPTGIAITESMLLGPGIADHAPPGTVVAPVHVADPTILTLLEVGHRVDLYTPSTGEQGAELVATGVQVLAVPKTAPSNLFDLNEGENTIFLAAIRGAEASLFTGASALAPFRVVISPTQNSGTTF